MQFPNNCTQIIKSPNLSTLKLMYNYCHLILPSHRVISQSVLSFLSIYHSNTIFHCSKQPRTHKITKSNRNWLASPSGSNTIARPFKGKPRYWVTYTRHLAARVVPPRDSSPRTQKQHRFHVPLGSNSSSAMRFLEKFQKRRDLF